MKRLLIAGAAIACLSTNAFAIDESVKTNFDIATHFYARYWTLAKNCSAELSPDEELEMISPIIDKATDADSHALIDAAEKQIAFEWHTTGNFPCDQDALTKYRVMYRESVKDLTEALDKAY